MKFRIKFYASANVSNPMYEIFEGYNEFIAKQNLYNKYPEALVLELTIIKTTINRPPLPLRWFITCLNVCLCYGPVTGTVTVMRKGKREGVCKKELIL